MTQTALQEPTSQTQVLPIDRFLALLKGHKSTRRGYIAHCPGPVHKNGDKGRSLEIWEDETDGHVGLKCYAGCTRQQIVEAVQITEQDLYKQDGTHKKGPARPTIDTFDLSREKDIHPNLFLLAWNIHDGTKEECTFTTKDGKTYVKRGVVIPYHNVDGTSYPRYRIRTALKAKEGTIWNAWDEKTQGKAPPPIPYGLEQLEKARKRGYQVIVEGESDCWTLWQWGFPALGIPGATNIENTLKMEYFTGIDRVYIIQEPDGAGKKVPENVYKHLQTIGYKGKIYALDLHGKTECKDPNELQHKNLHAFKNTFQNALDNATPMFPVVAMPKIARLCDLQDEVLPETRWAIPDILPAGLTLLVGKPKLGKSWLLLSMLLGIAGGTLVLGNIPVESGEVLYIALEDHKKRLQKRTNIVMNQAKASPNFYYTTEWNRLNAGGIEQLEEWLLTHPGTRIIGIDTWAKIKPKIQGRSNQQYDEDYDALTPVQELASKHGIAIVIVHHMRKQESEDPLDMISGSTAMQGAVDGFLLLYRKRGETDARLYVNGRDIEEEQELLLSFNQECATWTLKGNAEDYAGTPERQAILDVMNKYGQPIALKDLAKRLEKNPNTTRNLLASLRNENKVLLQNNMYSVVNHSKSSMPSNPSNHSKQMLIEGSVQPYDKHEKVTTDAPLPSNPIVTPFTPHVEPIQEVKKQEVTRVTRHTTDSSLHNEIAMKPPVELVEEAKAHYTKLLAYLKNMNVARVTWFVSSQDMYPETGNLKKKEYAAQMLALLQSGNPRNIQAAIDAIELKLGKMPGRRGDDSDR